MQIRVRGMTERRLESLGALDRRLDGSAVVFVVVVVVRVSRGQVPIGMLMKSLKGREPVDHEYARKYVNIDVWWHGCV